MAFNIKAKQTATKLEELGREESVATAGSEPKHARMFTSADIFGDD